MEDWDMLVFDLCCAILLLIIGLTGAFLPQYIYESGGRSLTFQVGSMLSGGVMLSAGMVHLLAESAEEISEKVEDFPLGHFLACCGFLLTLIVDQLTQEYLHKIGLGKIHDHHHHASDESLLTSQENSNTAQVSSYTAFLLTLALCLHSVLEGLALGAKDSVKSSIDIAVAIAAHKGLASYALAVSILDSKVEKEIYWMLLSCFSLTTPIAVMIGYIISEFSEPFVANCLTALAAGTFLYVALMEVIPNELEVKGNKSIKLLALVIGFGAMSIIAIWA